MNLKQEKQLDYYLGGLLICLAKPLTLLLGKILKIDHSTKVRGAIVVLKLKGGGSLAIALPALLGLKQKYPNVPLILVTTPAVAQFGTVLGIFDKVYQINDTSLWSLLTSSVQVVLSVIRADTVIDLEVYSRLSAIFTLVTLARNRLGFYLENVFWRQGIYTHLVFFNRMSGIFLFYERIATLLGATPAAYDECQQKLKSYLELRESSNVDVGLSIAISVGCSELGKERMLSPQQWKLVLKNSLSQEEPARITFFGGSTEYDFAEQVISIVKADWVQVKFQNACGRLTLEESLRELSQCDEFWGIDSGLLHFARLLGLKVRSFWGPTDPQTRLKNFPGLTEEILYKKVGCSPCIHIAEEPPCRGKNVCIQNLFSETLHAEVVIPVFLPPNPSLKINQ